MFGAAGAAVSKVEVDDAVAREVTEVALGGSAAHARDVGYLGGGGLGFVSRLTASRRLRTSP
jgi:hypothetical protein